jgi:hypothetical protein
MDSRQLSPERPRPPGNEMRRSELLFSFPFFSCYYRIARSLSISIGAEENLRYSLRFGVIEIVRRAFPVF